MHPAPTPVSPSVRAVASKPAPVTRALKELILGHDVACQLAAFLPSVAAIFPSGSSNLTIVPVLKKISIQESISCWNQSPCLSVMKDRERPEEQNDLKIKGKPEI